jgi:5-(carboxyamino)imidazole ribonucleotide synthase
MEPLTSPGPTVGVVGGGQLGRMLAEAAGPLGVELVVLDPTPDCPAAPVARDQIVADFDDEAAVLELADRADVLTFEIELADPELLERARSEADVPVHPSPETLRTIQDKLVQKQTLEDEGIPVPEFRAVDDPDDLRAAMDELGAPVMLKAREGGYDGRGNLPVETPEAASEALDEVGGTAMAEAFVDFERELSVIGVKGTDAIRTFPAGENIHEEEILRETIAPARAAPETLERAQDVAHDILELLDGRGVYGIELFEDQSGKILVNEIAPRPHNSGHWTIEGATASQFEQHIRAVLGWPLARAESRSPTVMTNLLGDVDSPRPAQLDGVETILAADGAHLHWYGKREARPLRKLGHVTLTELATELDTDDELLERARELRDATTFRS